MRTAPRRRCRDGLRPAEAIWDAAVVLAFGLAAVGIVAAVWSPQSRGAAEPQQVFVGTFDAAEAQANMISIRVTANASMKNIIHGSEITVDVPSGSTVAQLSHRLDDRYPILANPYAMVALNGGMLPLSFPLQDGQKVELMPPHLVLTSGSDGGIVLR